MGTPSFNKRNRIDHVKELPKKDACHGPKRPGRFAETNLSTLVFIFGFVDLHHFGIGNLDWRSDKAHRGSTFQNRGFQFLAIYYLGSHVADVSSGHAAIKLQICGTDG